MVVLFLEIGKNIYKIIGSSGKPWGGSSTAIIAGVGIRLINQALYLSEVELSLKEEVEDCFTFCDLDDNLLSESLHQKEVDLNKAMTLLFHTIVNALEKVKEISHRINDRFTSDFSLGVTYCYAAAIGCKTLMEANGLDYKKKAELDIFEQKIKEIIFHLQEKR